MFAIVAVPLAIRRQFTYSIPIGLRSIVFVGHCVEVPFGRNNTCIVGVVLDIVSDSPCLKIVIKSISKVLFRHFRFPKKLLFLVQWMSEQYACSLGEVLALILPNNFDYWVKNPDIDSVRHSIVVPPIIKPKFHINIQQQQVIQNIECHLKRQKFKKLLLHGVTASGKTEVYIQSIFHALSYNRQVLFLVPEVSLCTHFEDIFSSRFGHHFRTWNHKVSHIHRSQIRQEVLQQKVNIIIGTRSALFLPFQSLGLIVMDEEHDTAYKQESTPRYHARVVSEKLSVLHSAVFLSGSATPSVETFYTFQSTPEDYLTLPFKISNRKKVNIQIIDRKKWRNSKNAIMPPLLLDIQSLIQMKKQVILAVNRRGHSPYIVCMQCGFVFKCTKCCIALVYHYSSNEIKCHYCLYCVTVPSTCDRCFSKKLLFGGFGTEKVVEVLQKTNASFRIIRLDKDKVNKKGEYQRIYYAFKNHQYDILVGTKMVVQGLSFPNVALVGILDVDSSLFMSDFRSSENTFQWIVQSAGRTDRGLEQGKAVVQTINPKFYPIQLGVQESYKKFYDIELQLRKKFAYPPFMYLILFRFLTEGHEKYLHACANKMKDKLTQIFSNEIKTSDVEILGPSSSPHVYINSVLRWQLLVKYTQPQLMQRIINVYHDVAIKVHKKVKIKIDTDPYDFS